jgi:hypothetical protein
LVDITTDQETIVLASFEKWDTMEYSLPWQNCLSLAREVATAVGLKTSEGAFDPSKVSPAGFVAELRMMNDRDTPLRVAEAEGAPKANRRIPRWLDPFGALDDAMESMIQTLERVKQASGAAKQVEQTRAAGGQLEQARRTIEQVEQARRAAEQVEQARRAAEQAQPVVIPGPQ